MNKLVQFDQNFDFKKEGIIEKFPMSPECSTWHKFPNPGGAISNENVIFPIQGAQFWLKISYFQTRGQDFDQICPIYNPGGTILTPVVQVLQGALPRQYTGASIVSKKS